MTSLSWHGKERRRVVSRSMSSPVPAVLVCPAGDRVPSRIRLDQRWLSSDRDLGWWFRDMLHAETPLGPTTKVEALGHVEAFVSLDGTDRGARAGFSQIRAFVGVEVPIRAPRRGRGI